MNGIARELNISQLSVPHIENSKSTKLNIKILIGLLSVGVFVLLGLLGFFVYRRVNHFEELEDWELDSPHRFRYKELFRAAKGFRKSEIIGAGGFGVVYKGVLPATGVEVAVKKIGRNSIQGMREFAAEIESLGRLRHKHLVNLQGWCKRKNDLLLVYEYVPNGSLDSLLFKVKDNFVLSWEQRFSILKGVAAGLLYLHEEWEKVVIHRDVKSSNVLIDADMNARLGDFGLARLYDHGKVSHTTNVVGTIGYIAPELTRTGKASASSDVFAYGVLLVEVVCGRKPIDSDQLVMMDWVMECHEMGRILDCVDSRLNSNYIAEEVELVLKLGLICTFHKPEMRPTMRKIIRILHGDDPLPVLQKWTSVDSQTFDGTEFRSFEIISSDTIISSHPSSSFGGISSSSLQAGR